MLTKDEKTSPAAPPLRRRRPLALGAGILALAVGGALTFAVVRVDTTPTGIARVDEDLPATAMDEAVKPASNSPALVAQPGDHRFVVMPHRLDAPDFGCALQVSGDDGRSWIEAAPVPELPAQVDKCYAPEAAFGPDGRLYYLFVGLHGEGNEPVGAFLTTSDDRARTFRSPLQVLGPRNFAVRMVIDRSVAPQGRLHLVWLHASSDPPLGGFPADAPNPIMAAHSDDGGRTFSPPLQVSDPHRSRVVAPALTLGPDGTVQVAYYDLQDDARDYQGLEGPTWEGTWSVVLVTSRDGGRTFEGGETVDGAVVPSERVMLIFTMPPPSLVVGSQTACVAWTDARYGDPDVVARCSRDGGRRWSGLRRLNDDRVGTGARQYLPELSLAPDGRVDAVFLDRRADPTNRRNDVFYTYSTDQGLHFAANRKLNRDPSDSRKGAEYAGPAAEGQFEFGSRLGLLSRRRAAVAAWPDTRNSVSSPAQDIFVTTVELRGGGRSGPAGAVAGVLVSAGLVRTVRGMGFGRRRTARAAAGAGEDPVL